MTDKVWKRGIVGQIYFFISRELFKVVDERIYTIFVSVQNCPFRVSHRDVKTQFHYDYEFEYDQLNVKIVTASSKVTLFSGSADRQSVDTWFEVDLPFSIEPTKDCLKPGEKTHFKVTFVPLDAFDFKVRLRSTIGKNLLNYYCIQFLLLTNFWG